MVQNNFLQIDNKIIQHLYKLDIFIELVKMIATVKSNRGDLQECQKKILKVCILQTLVFLHRGLIIINLKKWNLKESVQSKIVCLFFIKM